MNRVPYDPDDDVEATPGVSLSQLAAGEATSVQHFAIAPGERVPEHDHPHEQAGFVTAGALTFLLADGATVTCEAGDSYVIAGGEAHAAENRGDERAEGVDVFSPPRVGVDWAE